MNIRRYILLFLFGFVLTGQMAFPQETNEKSRRVVKDRVLSSDKLPQIRLKFDKKFKFAGSQSFVLYDRAQAEQYFFVEADGGKIKRMLMLQFESFLPQIDAAYEYNEPRTVEIGGEKYFSNAEFVPNVEAALKAVPDSDIARAARFLQDKNFGLMQSLVFQRFVRLVDATKRSEIIVLYIENAENFDDAQKEKLLQNLSDRALKNFKILK